VQLALAGELPEALVAAFAGTDPDCVRPFVGIPNVPPSAGASREGSLLSQLATFIDQRIGDGTLQLPEAVMKRLVDKTKKDDASNSRRWKIHRILTNMYI
jgi:hypothetical protein